MTDRDIYLKKYLFQDLENTSREAQQIRIGAQCTPYS